RSREMFFSPWQAADYTGLKVEAIYELLASGEIAGEQVDGRWRLRKSVLDAWLDAEVSPEELEKLTTKMSRLSEEQARQVLVQVHAARAFAWRGAFSVHTWIAVKPAHAERYTRYEVIGWRLYRGLSPVSASSERAPDAQWFGANPRLLRDVRGAAAEAIIAALPDLVASYPYTDRYNVWPGPNSNTFTAYLARHLP